MGSNYDGGGAGKNTGNAGAMQAACKEMGPAID